MNRFSRCFVSIAALGAVFAADQVAIAADNVPGYFFRSWTVSADCTAAHGPTTHVKTGLKIGIAVAAADQTGTTYKVTATDSTLGDIDWKTVTLEYRAGAKLSKIPADFECVPGSEASSPFLAASNYAVSAEPWYEYEHWYAKVNIHGQDHHLIIFPREQKGRSGAVMVLQDASTGDLVRLNHNGMIHGDS